MKCPEFLMSGGYKMKQCYICGTLMSDDYIFDLCIVCLNKEIPNQTRYNDNTKENILSETII